MRCTAFYLTALLALPAVAQQDDTIYSWVDDQGQTHFGNQPPSADSVNPDRVLPLNSATQTTQTTRTARANQAQTNEDGIYTWTDSQGLVHYGNQPPAGINAKPVDIQPPPQSAPVELGDVPPVAPSEPAASAADVEDQDVNN